jgi:ribose 1,5-bisphosphate isomerase
MRKYKTDVKLKSIYRDKTSGASILSKKLFKILKEKSSKLKSRQDFLNFLADLKNGLEKHHPLLFQLHNLIEIISKSISNPEITSIFDEIKNIEKDFHEAGDKIARNFSALLNERGRDKLSLATLSYSGTVLISLAHLKDKISKVYVFRSCPNCEGEKMARLIAGLGLSALLVNDFGLDYVLNEVDLVVSGCDAVFVNGDVLNKAGTSAIFKIARSLGKETIVLFDFFKIMQKEISREKILKEAVESRKRNKFEEIDVIFDVVSFESISYYVTDFGIFSNKTIDESEIVHPLSKMFSLR